MFAAVFLAAAVNWSVPLDGPWKFKVGDDVRWADPRFDDGTWGTADLRAPASANDGDQGISHYAPGWSARGYNGYAGFAWYRIRLERTLPGDRDLGLLGPAMVDSAYQVYVDGRLLGGIGDFRSAIPVAYGIHPVKFELPSRPQLVAVRVWMGPFAAGPRSGGMHVAPVFGNEAGVDAVYRVQWSEKIRAFALEIVQAFFFIVLAIAALSLLPFDRARLALIALAVALLLTALWRANLTVFWLSGAESVQTLLRWHGIVLVPVTLGAWTLAWCYLLRLRESKWITIAASALTILYVAAKAAGPAAAFVSKWDRYGFILLLFYIVFRGIRERAPGAWFVLPALIFISIGQFAGELTALGAPGIWFPFGMGVSLTNYAYLFATPAIAALLWGRLGLAFFGERLRDF